VNLHGVSQKTKKSRTNRNSYRLQKWYSNEKFGATPLGRKGSYMEGTPGISRKHGKTMNERKKLVKGKGTVVRM